MLFVLADSRLWTCSLAQYLRTKTVGLCAPVSTVANLSDSRQLLVLILLAGSAREAIRDLRLVS